MAADDRHYTYNELTNEEKDLLLSHGYKPGELPTEDERELLDDLKAQMAGDPDSDRLSSDVMPDERDGAD